MSQAHNVTITDDPILSGKFCPYCGCESEMVNSSVIYGKDYGLIYLCLPCDAYVGVHDGTEIAKGRLADASLRALKRQAHEYFDNLWMRKMETDKIGRGKARKMAYKWLSRQLGTPFQETHIGMFNEEQTRRTIEICSPYFKQ